MLNVYVCEDNPKQLSYISKVIENLILIEALDMKLICSSTDPYDILEQTQNAQHTGLYFLDIDLNADINGLALAQEIRKYDPRCFIVFVTTHSEMSYMTFMYKVEALDFILKDNINELKERIHHCLLDVYQKYSSLHNTTQKTFNVKVNDYQINIEFNDILYFETSQNIHKIILHSKNRILEFNGKMKDIESLLDERFYRCHRSFIVNRDNIKEIDLKNRLIHMNDGSTCLISTRMLKGLTS